MALVCFGALDTTTKFVWTAAPVVMAPWLRYVLQTFSTLAVLWPRHRSRLFRTEHPRQQAARALLLLSCSAVAVFSLAVMQVGEVTAIIMPTPLLLTVIALIAACGVAGTRLTGRAQQVRLRLSSPATGVAAVARAYAGETHRRGDGNESPADGAGQDLRASQVPVGARRSRRNDLALQGERQRRDDRKRIGASPQR